MFVLFVIVIVVLLSTFKFLNSFCFFVFVCLFCKIIPGGVEVQSQMYKLLIYLITTGCTLIEYEERLIDHSSENLIGSNDKVFFLNQWHSYLALSG